MAHSIGVLFITTSAHFTAAAVTAARSVKLHNPDLSIGIFTDQAVTDSVFSFIGKIGNEGGRRKVDYISQTPYEHTLYLDSDVRVIGPLNDLFQLLDRFELAAAQVRYRTHPNRNRIWRESIPTAFPQANCGVLLFAKTPTVLKLFADWGQAMFEGGFKREQVPFRELLWFSDLKFTWLAPEYNLRSLSYTFWPTKEPLPLILHLKPLHSLTRWRRVLQQVQLMPTRVRLFWNRRYPAKATK
jgi:hypothetical protein